MRAVLTTKIQVKRFAVFAEMAWLARRPELGVLCRAAMAQGDQISVAIVQSALPGLPDAGANNVLLWCQMLGLCDQHGGLTKLGKAAAETDEAPIPEQGIYGFWAAQHPLLGSRLLAVERLKANRDHRFDAIEPLEVEPKREVLFRSVVDPGEYFMLRDLPTNHGEAGCLPLKTQTNCELRWTLDFDGEHDQWQLHGRMEAPRGGMKPIEHQPEVGGIDLWDLVAIWGVGPLADLGRWSEEERRLAVVFKGLTDAEQDGFQKTVELRALEVPGWGTYDTATLSDIPIGPSTAHEARLWTISRLNRELQSAPQYRSRGEIRHLFTDLVEGTPLERFTPSLPGHDELIEAYARHPKVFWSLAAPVDLAPHPVPLHELEALTIGTAAVDASVVKSAPSSPQTISVPYRSGWPMARLVQHLAQGTKPSAVLLCDRYVRGDDNLEALDMLVEAFCLLDEEVQFEVWTTGQKAELKQVEDITGSPPKTYGQVFGKHQPHDRYLLVRPDSGEPFGWHLSNSPLHARADVSDADCFTPLRWKDLAGTRVAAEVLMPALRQWLSGGSR